MPETFLKYWQCVWSAIGSPVASMSRDLQQCPECRSHSVQFCSILLSTYWRLLGRHSMHNKHSTYVRTDFRGLKCLIITLLSCRTLLHLCKGHLSILSGSFYICYVSQCVCVAIAKHHRDLFISNRDLFLTVLEAGSLGLGCQHGQGGTSLSGQSSHCVITWRKGPGSSVQSLL